MEKTLDEHYMQQALDLAEKGLGHSRPNPMVGAVLVKEGKVISTGYHARAGLPHAERVALDNAGKEAAGATLYVNLEPCYHHGRTPPCVEAVIQAGIARVVISNRDPNPRVNGKGIARLREAGIMVETGVLEEQGQKLNEVFFTFMEKERPFVALKAACSLDGKIATYSGESKWITGEEARADGRNLRHKYNGILTGVNTVLQDDPQLTSRCEGLQDPIRIVLDTRLRIPLEAKILNHEDSLDKTIIFSTRLAPVSRIREISRKARVEILEGLSLRIPEVLVRLAEMEITSLLVEGGAAIHGSFIKENLVDKFYLYYAPMLIGGRDAPGFFGGPGADSLNEAPRLTLDEVKHIGKDLRLTLYPQNRQQGRST